MLYKILLTIVFSINLSFAQTIPSVQQGENIQASKINQIITRQNNVARYIVKVYSNGTDWYEINNDGWVRQGREGVGGTGTATHSLTPIVKMASAPIKLRIMYLGAVYNAGEANFRYNRSSSSGDSFKYINNGAASGATISWDVEGFGDSVTVSALGATPSY